MKMNKFMGETNMSSMAKYGEWLNKMSRTILSRGIELSVLEMRESGILGIINYEAVYEDGLSVDEQAFRLIRRSKVDFPGGSVLVDSSLKGGSKGNPYRVYSGIVFTDIYAQHLWVMRSRGMYGDMMRVYGLSN
jgi:hypothetical protein